MYKEITLTCKVCGKEFIGHPHKKYCSDYRLHEENLVQWRAAYYRKKERIETGYEIESDVDSLEQNTSIEIREIPGFDGMYRVSSDGHVISMKKYLGKPRVLKPKVRGKGYLGVCLCVNNNPRYYLIHRLVALAFLPNLSNLPSVNHLDGIRSNNSSDNLEWCTQLENIQHSIQKPNSKKFRKLSFAQIQEICNLSTSEYGSCAKVAADYGISYNYAWNLCRGKTTLSKLILEGANDQHFGKI